MLKELYIQGFKSHRKFKINFSPNITTIRGSSARGKSDIRRALKWLTFNRPTGNTVINWDKDNKKALVKITTKDHTVKRIKSKTLNVYIVDKTKLKAFGMDVPKEVSKVLNMSEINFQQQFQAPFWFDLPAGQVSKKLNGIIDLSIIDNTLSNISSDLRSTTAEKRVCEQRLEQHRLSKKELDYLPEMLADYKNLKNLKNQLMKNALKQRTIDDNLKYAIKYKTNAVRLRKALLLGNFAMSKALSYSKIKKRRENLYLQLEKTYNIKETIEKAKLLENRLVKAIGRVCPLCKQKQG